jgi:hypothetical protein
MTNYSILAFLFQAAPGPVALDEVRNLHIQEYKAHASTVMIIAVISILITAPVGAIFITLLGPRLLEKKDIMDYQSMYCSIMQSSATYSCPSLSYHRGMVRSPSSWMI